MVCGIIGIPREVIRPNMLVLRVRWVQEVPLLILEDVLPQAFGVAETALQVYLLDESSNADLDGGRTALSLEEYFLIAVVGCLHGGEVEAEIGLLLSHSPLPLQFQSDESCLGLPSVKTKGVLVIVKTMFAGVLIGGEVDEMKDVDEGPQRNDELPLREGDVFRRPLVILVLVTAVPPPPCETPHLQEDIPVLLVVPSDEITSGVGDQSEVSHQGIALGLTDVEVLVLVGCADAGDDRLQVLQAGIEDAPVGEGEGLQESEGRSGIQSVIAMIELSPCLEDDVHPGFVGQEGMRLHLPTDLVEVDEVIHHQFGNTSSLDHGYMIVPLLIDTTWLDQTQVVPLRQHPYLAEVGRSWQSSPQLLLLIETIRNRGILGVDVPEAFPDYSLGQFFLREFELVVLEGLLVEEISGVFAQLQEGVVDVRVFALVDDDDVQWTCLAPLLQFIHAYFTQLSGQSCILKSQGKLAQKNPVMPLAG